MSAKIAIGSPEFDATAWCAAARRFGITAILSHDGRLGLWWDDVERPGDTGEEELDLYRAFNDPANKRVLRRYLAPSSPL